MAKPTKYDVMLQGKKVGGAAQRRTKLGFLHQGTISLQIVPEKYLQELLKPDNCVLEAMRRYSFPLIDENCTAQELKEARAVIRQYLIESLPQSAEC